MRTGRWGCCIGLLVAIKLPMGLQKPCYSWGVEPVEPAEHNADSWAVEYDVHQIDWPDHAWEDGRAFQRDDFHSALICGTESEKNNHGPSGPDDHQKDTLACSNYHEGPKEFSAELHTDDEWERLLSLPRFPCDFSQTPTNLQNDPLFPGAQPFPSQQARPFDPVESLLPSEFFNQRHFSTDFGWSESQVRGPGNPISKFRNGDCWITPKVFFERLLRPDGQDNDKHIWKGHRRENLASALIGTGPQPSTDISMPQSDDIPFMALMASTDRMGSHQEANIMDINHRAHMGTIPMTQKEYGGIVGRGYHDEYRPTLGQNVRLASQFKKQRISTENGAIAPQWEGLSNEKNQLHSVHDFSGFHLDSLTKGTQQIVTSSTESLKRDEGSHRELPGEIVDKYNKQVVEKQHAETDELYLFGKELLGNSLLEVRGKRKASIYPGSKVLSSKKATMAGSSNHPLVFPELERNPHALNSRYHYQVERPEYYVPSSLLNTKFGNKSGNGKSEEEYCSSGSPQHRSTKLVETGYIDGPYPVSSIKEVEFHTHLEIPKKHKAERYTIESNSIEKINSAQGTKICNSEIEFPSKNNPKDSESGQSDSNHSGLPQNSSNLVKGELSFLQLENGKDLSLEASYLWEKSDTDLICFIESIKSSSTNQNLKMLTKGQIWIEEEFAADLCRAYRKSILRYHPRNSLIEHDRQVHISTYFFKLADKESKIIGLETNIQELIYEIGAVLHNKIFKKRVEFQTCLRSRNFVKKCMEIVETTTKGFLFMIHICHAIFKAKGQHSINVRDQQRGAWNFIEKFWKDFELFQTDSVQKYTWLNESNTKKGGIDAELAHITVAINKGKSYTVDKKISLKIFSFWLEQYRHTLFKTICHSGHQIHRFWMQFINDLLLYSSPEMELQRNSSKLLEIQFQKVIFFMDTLKIDNTISNDFHV